MWVIYRWSSIRDQTSKCFKIWRVECQGLLGDCLLWHRAKDILSRLQRLCPTIEKVSLGSALHYQNRCWSQYDQRSSENQIIEIKKDLLQEILEADFGSGKSLQV